MALEIRQQLKLSQQLVMTPQLQQAIKLLQLSRMELMDVVRVPMEMSWSKKPASEEEMELDAQLDKAVRNELSKIEAELRAAGLDVKTVIEKGNPLKEILRLEKDETVSAIVIGSHGKSNLKEMLLGSVSENVIRHSKSPVLVIKR